MSILAIGSVALDTVETPHGRAERVIGGSATFFSAAASVIAPVRVVAVVGDDYPLERLRFLTERSTDLNGPIGFDVDLAGIEQRPGRSFFWAGRYHEGFGARETLATRLGVFADFNPVVPAAFRDSEMVFLGNIDPVLQARVLDQIPAPGLVAADTMNFWIEGSRDALLRLLGRIDLLFVNDEEARQLSGQTDLAMAARWIRAHGPRIVVVKRGAEGAMGFGEGWSASCPGYPVPKIVDPTGAGDAFAGGLLGYLHRIAAHDARSRDEVVRTLQRVPAEPEFLTTPLSCGAAMGSFAVEGFSVEPFRDFDFDEWQRRWSALSDATSER